MGIVVHNKYKKEKTSRTRNLKISKIDISGGLMFSRTPGADDDDAYNCIFDVFSVYPHDLF